MGDFSDVGNDMVRALAAGLYQAGLDIMYVSQHEVPVDTATLKSSGRVQAPELVGSTVVCELGYGYGEEVNPKTGEVAAQYAVPVHEKTWVKHAPPTKAKFLEDPALSYVSLFGPTLAVWIARVTSGAGGLNTFMEDITPSESAMQLASLEGVSGDAVRGSTAEFSSGAGAARVVGDFLRGMA